MLSQVQEPLQSPVGPWNPNVRPLSFYWVFGLAGSIFYTPSIVVTAQAANLVLAWSYVGMSRQQKDGNQEMSIFYTHDLHPF